MGTSRTDKRTGRRTDRFALSISRVSVLTHDKILQHLVALWFLPRDAMHKRDLCRHAVSVGRSVCLSRSWIMSKRINISSKFFSPLGSHTMLVFPHQTGWQYSDGNHRNGGVECRWGRQKTTFWTNIWLCCLLVYSVVNRRGHEV